jgi:hypothetical protein
LVETVKNIPDLDTSHLTVEQISEAKRLSEDPSRRKMLYLVKHRIPWELANSLDASETDAFVNAIARVTGGTVDSIAAPLLAKSGE